MIVNLFIISLFATLASSQDYCNLAALNCKKSQHVGCNHKGVFDPSACKKWPNVELFNFGAAEIAIMVDEHNKRRNEAAFGRAVAGISADRLCTMKWHTELAKIAGFNVLSCLDDHDECRNTYEFPHSGQNLYNFYSTSKLTDEAVIKKTVEKWYDERKFADVNVIKKKPPGGCGKHGHFTQLVWHNSCFVGCAGARYSIGNKNHGYIVCNYSFGNMIEHAIYSIGKTASECKTGTHKKYRGLCSSREVFEIPQANSLKMKQKDEDDEKHHHHHHHHHGGKTHHHYHHYHY